MSVLRGVQQPPETTTDGDQQDDDDDKEDEVLKNFRALSRELDSHFAARTKNLKGAKDIITENARFLHREAEAAAENAAGRASGR